jgi:hypothetical protein
MALTETQMDRIRRVFVRSRESEKEMMERVRPRLFKYAELEERYVPETLDTIFDTLLEDYPPPAGQHDFRIERTGIWLDGRFYPLTPDQIRIVRVLHEHHERCRDSPDVDPWLCAKEVIRAAGIDITDRTLRTHLRDLPLRVRALIGSRNGACGGYRLNLSRPH